MEKNRKILLSALKRLTQLKPEDKIWESIDENINRKHLTGKLLRFTPPDSVWESIEEDLHIRKLTRNLNNFDPPSDVWQNIEYQLNTDPSRKNTSTIGLWLRWSIAAAAVLTIGLIVYLTLIDFDKEISFSEEWIEKQDSQEWTSDEELLEKTIFLICQEKPDVCRSPKFKKMEDELVFLTQTKEDIISRMNPYENDSEMALMLTKIELERTDIINQMVALIN